MTVILAIAVVVAIAFMGLLTTRVTAIEKQRSDTSDFDELKRYTTESVKTSNGNFASIATRFDKENERIEDIINQLEAITADIKRLDEEIAKVAKAEREIRSYYVNYREPNALPVYGVPWAKGTKCFDDMSDEEKIQELSKRADTYLDLMEKGNTADMVRYTEEYNKCIAEIQQLLKGEDNDN